MNRLLRFKSLFALTFFFFSPLSFRAWDDSVWPQWRGPRGDGISNEKNLPVEWSATKNIKWKTRIAGRGHSSPVVWGNRIFLTTSIEGLVIEGAEAVRHIYKGQEYRHPDSLGATNEQTLKLLCIDSDTGKIVWDRTLYQGSVYDNRHRKNTYASATCATDGVGVFVSFEAEGVYCYDFNGKRVWKKSVGRIAKGGLGPGTSPVLFENLMILQCDQEYGEGSFITALDKATGKQVWKTPREHRRSWSTPLLVRAAGRVELIAAGGESVIAYDPATGKELWRAEGVSSFSIPSPVAGHDMVFVSAGSEDKRALAIRTGDVDAKSRVVWRYEKGAAYVPSPILYGDYFYLMTDSGIITCIEARTGRVVYEGRPSAPALFSASPVAFDGKILITSEDGDTFVIRAGPRFELLHTNSLDEPVYASLALANGKIFIRGDKHLYCIASDAKDAK
jgi:outer membrane protein assembly factor BamB